LVGLGEMLAGAYLLRLGGDWKGAGYFLTGIAGVVLVAAAVWVRNEPYARPLPLLGWVAFEIVHLQGLVVGLRLRLFKFEIVISHATLAKLFFVLLCTIAVLTTRWWRRLVEAESRRVGAPNFDLETVETVDSATARVTTSLKRGVNERVGEGSLV